MLFEEPPCKLNDFGFLATGRFFNPDVEIISAFRGCSRWRLSCASQIPPRFIEPRWRSMKGEFRQANQGFRYAGALGKIMNELLQRSFSSLVAFGRLQQAFLQAQVGARLPVTACLFQFSVIS